MFCNPYVNEDDATVAQPFLSLTSNADQDSLTEPHVLVADSDNDDSLKVPPPPTSAAVNDAEHASPTRPRAFSKRAAKCAAALLHKHTTATSAAQQQACIQQLRRLGGPYRPLGQGHEMTVWVRNAELNARVIQETEAFFEGRLSDRLTAPYISRATGTVKPNVHLQDSTRTPTISGARHPLPTSATKTTADATTSFGLSRGEQCTLSLLSMEEGEERTSAPQTPMPTYLLRKNAQGELQRVSVPSTLLSENSPRGTFGLSSLDSMSPCGLYTGDAVDSDEGLSSVQSSPSAAHSAESPSAATRHVKRSRTSASSCGEKRPRPASSTVARSLFANTPSIPYTKSTLKTDDGIKEDDDEADDDDVFDNASLYGGTCVSTSCAAPKSLSATVIERQNHRVQWDLFRQQSLFSPF